MKRWFMAGALLLPALQPVPERPAAPGAVPNAMLEITEETLNTLMGRLGSLAGAGFYRPLTGLPPALFENCQPFGEMSCPASSHGTQLSLCTVPGEGGVLVPSGDPVPWQWWASEAHFTLSDGSMAFTATVHSRVGELKNVETRTVAASIGFDAGRSRLRVEMAPFTVPVQWEGLPVTQVDVSRLFAISVPIEPQQISIPLPSGETRTLTARATGISTQYLPQKVVISVDIGF